jgi:hypothetical protein
MDTATVHVRVRPAFVDEAELVYITIGAMSVLAMLAGANVGQAAINAVYFIHSVIGVRFCVSIHCRSCVAQVMWTEPTQRINPHFNDYRIHEYANELKV